MTGLILFHSARMSVLPVRLNNKAKVNERCDRSVVVISSKLSSQGRCLLYARLDILESEVRRFSHDSLNFIIFVWAYIIHYNHSNITVITKWEIKIVLYSDHLALCCVYSPLTVLVVKWYIHNYMNKTKNHRYSQNIITIKFER